MTPFLEKRILAHMAIRCKKRRISFLSGISLFGSGREGEGEGEGGWLREPGLNLNFPHVLTFPEYISKYLGVSTV